MRLVEEELEAAQSKRRSKDVTFFRLDNGRASRSKVGGKKGYFIFKRCSFLLK